MTNTTDTSKASEDMVDDFYSLPPTSRTKANLRDYIRTEKLKLLAEVRERATPSPTTPAGENEFVSLEALAKLEAEL